VQCRDILEGWWIPADEPRAELIFVHGAGSNRISQYIGSLDFYRTLHELDISVVTMDIRNHGNSPVTDGILRMGGEEWRDVIAAARWLDENHASSLPRILLGASMGGSTVIHALHHGLRAEAAMLLERGEASPMERAVVPRPSHGSLTRRGLRPDTDSRPLR